MVGNITAKPAAATAATDAAATATQSYRLVAPGIRATVIAYGARLTSLEVLDRDGKWREVVVGHKDVNTYKQEASPSYYGCVVG
jgi:galactose mutarotase-like enzyme